MARYLGSPSEWEGLLAVAMRQEEVGLDTEYIEVGDRKLVTVWSLGLYRPSKTLHPRGYYLATGYCLPWAALLTFRPLLESGDITKWAHNAPAETRSIFDTAGYQLAATNCTLQWARVALPNHGDYGIKALSSSCLGKPQRDSYEDVTGWVETVRRVKKTVEVKLCTCGVERCRKRKGHLRERVVTETVEEKEIFRQYDQRDFNPRHPRWERWVAYSCDDAVDALEEASFLKNLKTGRPDDPFSERWCAKARSLLL